MAELAAAALPAAADEAAPTKSPQRTADPTCEMEAQTQIKPATVERELSDGQTEKYLLPYVTLLCCASNFPRVKEAVRADRRRSVHI
eukprot:6177177-Pleurochrysis_carterae.AAC.2